MEGCQTLTSLKRLNVRLSLFHLTTRTHDDDTLQFSAYNFCNSQHRGGVSLLFFYGLICARL